MKRLCNDYRIAKRVQKELQAKDPFAEVNIYLNKKTHPKSNFKYYVGTRFEWLER